MRKALAVTLLGVTGAYGQSQPAGAKVDHASSYYHYTVAHMYAELASAFRNRTDYLNQAVDHYKEAIKADPTASMLSEELSDLYVQSGRLREAQADAEETLKKNPNDLNAHRLLARIFTRLVGDGGRVDEAMLRRAIDEYQKVTSLAPRDIDALLMLARLHKANDNSVDAQKTYEKVLSIDPANEDALTGLALVYSDLGDNRKAAELLKTLSDKNPSPRSLHALALAYEQMREFDQAANVLRRELELNPPNERDIKRNLAQDLTLARKYEEALTVYQELAADDPADATAHLRISQIYRQKRDFAAARIAGEKAKALEPNSIEVRYNEVNILEAEDRIPEAIQSLKDIIQSTTKRNYNQGERAYRVALLERLATLQKSMDQTEAAVDTFRQMSDVDPSLGSRVAAEVIDAYRSGKEFAKAQQESEAAGRKYPEDRRLRMVRNSLLAELGKVDDAANDMKKLMEGKGDVETWVATAQVYEKGKRWNDMAKALDAAEKLADSNEEKENIWFMRGAMYERMNRIDLAEVEFRKVLRVDPESAGAMNYIGYMLADRNTRLQESYDMITGALDRDPGNGAYLDSLGWSLFRLGRYEDAEKTLKRAVAKTPKDPTVHHHLAETLMKLGKVREAVAEWQASLHEWDTSSPAELRPEEVAEVKSKLENAKVRLAREVTPANNN
ncbi:MAG: tetratricopeptide repeat protein [Bryobacteraceae bacterium]